MMTMESTKASTTETKATTGPKRPGRNDQCIACGRQCYNSGLCMMPWPGLTITEEKKTFLKKQAPRPKRTCRSSHVKD